MRATSPSRRVDTGLKNKSIFNPQNPSNHFMEAFKSLVINDIENLTPQNRVNPEYIREGIKSLEEKKDLII